jgi:hypothetical protein
MYEHQYWNVMCEPYYENVYLPFRMSLCVYAQVRDSSKLTAPLDNK